MLLGLAALLAAAGCREGRASGDLIDAALPDLDASPPGMRIPSARADAGGSEAGRSNRRSADDSSEADSGAAEPEAPELDPQAGLLVSLPSGRLWGLQVRSIRAFLGIPFGTVPERFAPAQRAERWSGARDATRHGPSCPQADNGLASHAEENEDCLTLR